MTDQQQKLVPKLRFRGFTEDWQQEKLKDIANFSKGKGYRLKDVTETGTPIIFYGSLYTNFQEIIYNSGTFVKSVPNSVISEGNEVIVPSSGETAIEIARASAVKKPGIILGGDLNILSVEKQSTGFVAYYLNSIGPSLSKLAQGNSVVHLYNHHLRDVQIKLPTLDEQIKIVKLLEKLNEMITLNQEKLRVQKLSYKYYRDTLIADFQSLSTKINFNSSIWKAVKLKNILKEYVEKTTTENQTLLLSSTNNGIELRDGRVDGTSNIGYKILRKYSLVLSPQNLWLGNINYNDKFEMGMVSPSYKTYVIQNVNKDYFKHLLRHPYMLYQYGTASVQGASVVRRNLDISAFNNIKLPIPTSTETQKQIAEFLDSILLKVEQQEKYLEDLKKLKRYLLNNLFV